MEDISYNPIERRLELEIDARITVDHPRCSSVTEFEDYFERIKLVFEGVRFLDIIVDRGISSVSQSDLGDIDCLTIHERDSVDDLSAVQFPTVAEEYVRGSQKWHGVQSTIAKYCCEFFSDHICFLVGYENLTLSPVA